MKLFKLILGTILTLLAVAVFNYGFDIIEEIIKKKSSLYEYLISPLILLFFGILMLSSLKNDREMK